MPEVTDEFIDRLAKVESLVASIPPTLDRVGALERKARSTRIVTALIIRSLLAEDFGVVQGCERILRKWERNNKGLRDIVKSLLKKLGETGNPSYSETHE